MTDIRFYPPGEIRDESVRYVVIAARFSDRWIFCRHKARRTWEIPGGHKEPGETAYEGARRELWEETGATEAELFQVGGYSVTKNGETSCGQLYFALVTKLDSIPDTSEMEEILLADKLPARLTYEDIQPELFSRIQGWLNTQSNAGELWDVYDENRCLTGRLHRRGDCLRKGEYHLVVHVWIRNSRGEYLITKRSPNKGFPNMWECTGGSALAGDDSLTAALREVREETGLTLQPDSGSCILSVRKNDYFRDVWLFQQDFCLEDVVLLPGETVDKRCADMETFKNCLTRGNLFPMIIWMHYGN